MAQTAEEALIVRMEASLTKFERQMARAKKVAADTSQGIEDRFGRTNKRISDSATGAATGLSKIVNISSSGRFVLQNTANQIGDIAVQMASGTAASRALAQQLPQMLGGFGALGGALGVVGPLLGLVAAIGIPVATMLIGVAGSSMNAADRTKALSEAIKELDGSLRNYKSAIEGASIDNLISQFGRITPQILELQEQLQALRLQEILLNAATAAQALSDAFDYDGFLSTGAMDLAKLFNLNLGQLARMQGLLNQIGTATTISDQVAAIDRLQEYIMKSAGGLEQMTAEQMAFYRQTLEAESALRAAETAAGGVSGAVAGAANEAARLAGNVMGAVAAFNALSRSQAVAGAQGSGRGDGMAEWRARSGVGGYSSASDYLGSASPELKKQIDGMLNPRVSSRGGGGKGGASASEREDLAKVKQLFQQTRTEAEKYAIELAEVNELHTKGKIDGDLYNRSLDHLREKYLQAGDAAKFWEKQAEALKDGMLDAIVSGESLSDVFQNLAKSIAKAALEAALFGSGPFSGGGGGGLLSGIISSFGGKAPSYDGGGYTGAGSRTGGIDGRGGFPAILHPNETVVDHTRGGSGGKRAAIIQVSINGAAGNSEVRQLVAQGVRQGISAYDAEILPQRVQQVRADPRRVGY